MTTDFTARVQAALSAAGAEMTEPQEGDRQAAVTVLLGEVGDEPAVLFVRRAESVNDPWSGHTALPGGHRSPTDADLLDTARRETLEEVGIDLPRDSYLGRLDDRRPSARTPSLIVAAFVAVTDGAVQIRRSHEIQSHRWIPISALRDPAYRSELSHLSRGLRLVFPSIVYRELTIWGLTHQILSNFLDVIDDVFSTVSQEPSA